MALGALAGYLIRKSQIVNLNSSLEQEGKRKVDEAETKAKEIVLEAKEKAAAFVTEAKNDEREQKNRLASLESRLIEREETLDKKLSNIVVVSPDAGGAKRARRLAKLINSSLAIVDKRRPQHGIAETMNIIGDVKGKTAILVDDIIDTAGTLASAAKLLSEKGAKEIYVCATHPLFSGQAIERLNSDLIKEVIVTNTVHLPKEKIIKKIKIISLASLLAESIKRIYEGSPMGILFEGLYNKLSKKAGYKNER